jgi:hypothetical protein
METDIVKFADAMGFTYLTPIVGYMVGMAFNKAIGAPKKVNKRWAMFCLAAPIIGLAMFVNVDSELLRRLWSTSPVALSLCAVFFGLLVPAALVAAIVRLWRMD